MKSSHIGEIVRGALGIALVFALALAASCGGNAKKK